MDLVYDNLVGFIADNIHIILTVLPFDEKLQVLVCRKIGVGSMVKKFLGDVKKELIYALYEQYERECNEEI